MGTTDTGLEGGCDCGALRYRLLSPPLIVHCCHCRWCQRESGAAFALNAMIESDRVQNLGVAPELIDTPSASGQGQRIARCPRCRVAVWSHYAGAGPVTSFVRVGTLDKPDALPPDVHIFTASKQPWVQLAPDTPAFSDFYEREQVWPADSLRRRQQLLPQIEAHAARQRSAPVVADAQALAARWVAHFNDADLPAMLALYDAQALLWPTTVARLLDTPAAIGAYFAEAFAQTPRPRMLLVSQTTRHFGHMATCIGAYTLHLATSAGERTLPARFSFTLRSDGAAWRIVEHHSSLMPSAPLSAIERTATSSRAP